VWIAPSGSVITSPDGKAIVTDGPGGRYEFQSVQFPNDVVILDKGRFLELFEAAIEDGK
jgi:hypothetical protein